MDGMDRRSLLLGAGMLAAAAGPAQAAARRARGQAGAGAGTGDVMPAQTDWPPAPAQAPVHEGVAELGDARLWYWDTGGKGEPIILLHPRTGSATGWIYQQPVFARAGYRVIAYSRRGHFRSDNGPKDRPGTATGDLKALVDHLGLGRFHLMGSALGGFIAPDFAFAWPKRLLSLIIASSYVGLNDPDYAATSARLAPGGFAEMPADFRELGPSYRAANPAGVAAWNALEAAAHSPDAPFQPMLRRLSWADIEQIAVPTLMLTGDADLYMPPPRLREFARRMRDCRTVTIAEAGHAPHWEQPDAFNRAVLDFLRQHRA